VGQRDRGVTSLTDGGSGAAGLGLRVWYVESAIRRFAKASALFFVVLAALLTAIGIVLAGAVLVWLVCLVVLACVWRVYLVPYVALGPDGLEVQGAFAHRALSYASIREARPGLYGLQIRTMDGNTIVGWAVQKSKFAEWFHRHTRADDVVADIMDRVERAKAEGAPRSRASTR
jgi:hypothetical protein